GGGKWGRMKLVSFWSCNIRAVVDRCRIAKLFYRQIGFDGALMLDDKAQRISGLADDCKIETPFAEDRFGFLLLCRIEYHEHALLAFRKQHFVSRHAGLAARNAI